MQNFWQIEHQVDYSEVDSFNKLRIDGILSLLQLITTFHSKEMGVDGYNTAKKSNAFWVVSKFKLKILDIPKLFDHLKVETWPTTVSAIRFNRDYKIIKENSPCVLATSEWCTLDLDTKSLRKTSSICYPFDMEHIKDRSGAGEFSRVTNTTEEQDYSHTHTVLYVDIDSNKHTNNLAYIRMALNAFTPQELQDFNVKEIEVYFQSQSYYKDQIKVYKKQTETGYLVQGNLGDKTIFSIILAK